MPFTPEELAAINARSREQDPADPFGKSSESVFDWTGSFLRSSVENSLDIFGVPKSANNVAWEAKHPLAGMAAGFLGIGGTYGGFYKATKNIKRAEGLLDSVSGIVNSPIRGGAVKEALRFSPLEASRIVGTAIQQPENLDEALFESAVNLSLGGVFGAIGGIPAKYGTVGDTLKRVAPGVDLKNPTTLQLRELRQLVADGKVAPENMALVQRAINQLDGAVRFEEYTTNPNSIIQPRYITNLYDAYGLPETKLSRTSWLNSFFKPQENKLFSSQKLNAKLDDPKHGLGDEAAVQAIMGKLPQHSTSFMQFPRLLTLKAENPKFHNLWRSRFSQYATPVGDGTYLAREAEDGMYVFIKKLKGDPNVIAKDDQFLLFKTDRPDYFEPRAAGWMSGQVEQAMWWAKQFPQNQKLLPGGYQDFVRKSVEMNPLRDVTDLSQAQDNKSFISKLLGQFGVKPGEQSSDAYKAVMAYAQEHFAPTVAQWIGDGPGKLRARWLWGTIKPTLERANALAEAMIYGQPTVKDGKSLATSLLFHGAKDLYLNSDKTVWGMIQKLSNEDRSKLKQIMAGAWDLGTVNERHIAGDITDELHGLLTRLEELSTIQWNELNALRGNLGMPKAAARKGHFMMAHQWDGDWRLRIRNEEGNTIYMVGAPTRGDAIKQAEAVVANAGMQGKWKFNAAGETTEDLFRRGFEHNSDDVSSILGINTQGGDFRRAASAMEKYIRESRKPKQLKGRAGVEGYDADMSDQAIAERLLRHTRQMQTHLADTALRAELYPQLMKLMDENPGILRQVQERWANLLGAQGKFSQMQNDVADKLLAPYLGNNSASKIVGAANTAEHNLRLGSFNLMYPAVNMLTFMTTTLPQVSFVASAPYKTLSQWYTSILAHGADGLAKRQVHVLDPLKMVYQGFRLMGRADKDPEVKTAFEKAMRDGVFAPRLVEEHIGVDAQLKGKLSALLKEPNGFPKFIQYLSEWLPNKSEQFSRLHSFTTGLATGREILGLSDDALYRFAKEFTHNTMFGYTMADRAKVIQGPMGAFFGLYKNWQMHYLSMLLSYAGEAKAGNFAPLLWSQAGLMGVGGLGGTTGYGIADAFSRIATGKSAFTNAYNMFSTEEDAGPDTFSDVAFYGLPAFLGLSLQSSTSSFGSNPAKDAAMLFGFVQAERGQAIGRAIGSAIDTWTSTGQNPFTDKLNRDQMLKAVAPRSLIRSAQVLEGDFVRSLNTGNPLVQGLSPMERFIYAAGFNTPEIDRTFRVSDELFKSAEKRKIAVRYYARKLQELQDRQDYEGLTRLRAVVVASGVGMDSVLRSASAMRDRNLKDLSSYRLQKTSPEHLREFVEASRDEASTEELAD